MRNRVTAEAAEKAILTSTVSSSFSVSLYITWRIRVLMHSATAVALLAHGLQHLRPPEQLVERLVGPVAPGQAGGRRHPELGASDDHAQRRGPGPQPLGGPPALVIAAAHQGRLRVRAINPGTGSVTNTHPGTQPWRPLQRTRRTVLERGEEAFVGSREFPHPVGLKVLTDGIEVDTNRSQLFRHAVCLGEL